MQYKRAATEANSTEAAFAEDCGGGVLADPVTTEPESPYVPNFVVL
jgi:hypothetical protein